MTSTVSGFSYPGDFNYNIKRSSLLVTTSLLAIIYGITFFYFDLNRTNLLNIIDFKSIFLSKESIASKDIYFIIYIVILSLARIIFMYYSLIQEVKSRMLKFNMNDLFTYMSHFLIGIVVLEIFLPLFLPFFALMFFPAVIIVPILTIRKFKQLIASPFSQEEYPFQIKPENIIKTKSFRLLNQNEKYFVLAEKNKISVYTKDNYAEPLHILKGHENNISEILLTKNFLISVSRESKEIGLWDIYNNFEFRDLHKNIEPGGYNEESIFKNFQEVDNSIYFHNKSTFFVNNSNFLSPSSTLIEIKKKEIIDYKVDNNYMYLLLLDIFDTSFYVEIRSLNDNELISSTEDDIRTKEHFGGIQIGSDNILIYSNLRIINYECKADNNPQLNQLQIIEISNDFHSCESSNSEYFIHKTLIESKSFSFKDSYSVKIYYNSSFFNLLQEYTISDISSIFISQDNDVFVLSSDGRTIFHYSVIQLLGN